MIPAQLLSPIPHIFLGRGDGNALLINVLYPSRKDLTSLICEVSTPEGKVHIERASFRDDIARLFTFHFHNLTHGLTYQYRFITSEGTELELGDGLKASDLEFTYWKYLQGHGDAVLMSCNGVYNYKGKEKNRFRMWDKVLESAKKNKTQLLILGGDQYYQDAVEGDWLKKLNNEFFKENYVAFKTASINNALSYMSHPSYRKLMAKIPSIAMLDDHDLTDGAGGRFFKTDKEFTDEWTNFVTVQKEVFSLLQASRNPTPIRVKSTGAYSFILDLGETAIAAFDLRTEKNSEKKLLMERDSKEDFFKAISELPHKQVFFLLPVVPLRNSQKFEAWQIKIIKLCTDLAGTKLLARWPRVQHAVEYLAECRDDLNDGLNSECNIDFLAELFQLMAAGSGRGTHYAILSGDIHTGGAVDLRADVQGVRFSVPILVSSPIGYDPMPELLEPLLREKKLIFVEHNGVAITGVVGRFTTLRNFMSVQLNRFFCEPNESVTIYEERIGTRRVLVQDLSPDDDHEYSDKTASSPVQDNRQAEL